MLLRIAITFILLSLSLSANANVACLSTINQIHSDLTSVSRESQNQTFPWMHVSWLWHRLGKAHAKQTSHHLFKYTWKCYDNTGSYLTTLTDNQGNVLNVEGIYSSSNGSGMFSINLNHHAKQTQNIVMNQQTSMNQQSAVNQQVAVSQQAASEKILAKYNLFFKTSIQHIQQVALDNFPRVKNYYSNLRQCHPGAYQYAMPIMADIAFPTSIIQGNQNNFCLVHTSYASDLSGGKVEMKCQYPLPSLTLFTDKAAEELAEGYISSNPLNPTPLQKLIQTQCQVYINGQKQNVAVI